MQEPKFKTGDTAYFRRGNSIDSIVVTSQAKDRFYTYYNGILEESLYESKLELFNLILDTNQQKLLDLERKTEKQKKIVIKLLAKKQELSTEKLL